MLAAIAGVVAACAGFAALLASLAGAPFLDAYLATTPGGMPAVLATAAGAQADTTFVLAVQTLRLLIMVAVAPPLVRLWLAGRPVSRRRLESTHMGAIVTDTAPADARR